jgi:hypothetical protein
MQMTENRKDVGAHCCAPGFEFGILVIRICFEFRILIFFRFGQGRRDFNFREAVNGWS